MKKAFLLIAALSLASASYIFANDPPPVAVKIPNDLKQAISKHISYPAFARNNFTEGVVTMCVTLDDSCTLKIMKLNSTNPKLGEYVSQELSDLKISNTSFQPGNVYYMKIRFNLISGF